MAKTNDADTLSLKTDKRFQSEMEEFQRLWDRLQGAVRVDSRHEVEIVLAYLKEQAGVMRLAVAGLNNEEKVRAKVRANATSAFTGQPIRSEDDLQKATQTVLNTKEKNRGE